MDEQARRQGQLKEMFEAFMSTGDIAALLAMVSEDVVLRLTVLPGTPLSGEFRGKEGLKEYFRRNSEVVRTDAMEIVSYLAGGDQVAVVGRETLTVLRSGQMHGDADWVTIFTFRGDEIANILVVEDTAPISAAYAADR